MVYVDEKIKDIIRIPQPEGRGKYIRLDQNENPDGVPQWLFDSVIEKITPEFLSIYPEETGLTEKYAEKMGLKLENVTLTDGSVVGMGYLIKIFGEEGKNLISVTPTFGMYMVYGEMNGMTPVLIPYESDMTFRIEKMLDAIDDNTGIVVMVNPNMPVGNTYSPEDIEAVVSKAEKVGAMVIIDEAYHYYCDASSIDLVRKHSNVAILRTFSKMLSIPALRLGVIISCPDNIRYVNAYKPHYTVNSIALLFGEVIIDNHDKLVSELKKKYENGLGYVTKRLKDEGYQYIPSDGCFMCIKPQYRSSEYITDRLKENGILILCGKGDLKGYLRLSICDEKYMKTFMDTLQKIDLPE